MSSSKLNVKTNSLPNSRIAVQIEIPAERCKTSYEAALSRLSQTANLPGFRKGKVPRAVILQQIGSERIKASALEKLLQTAWEEAIDEKSLEPLCEPEIKDGFEPLLVNFKPDADLTITFETDVSPNPLLKNTKGLIAETERIVFDAKKVDELIEQSRKQLATIIPVEKRPAKMGDIAVISFKGKYKDDGSEIKGGSSDSMDLELEDGKMIPGFIEGIIGMEVNKEKSIECKFPDNYHEESSQGREADFTVKLIDLKTRELPKLDDDFAKQASDKNTMVELKEDLEKRLKEEVERNQIKTRQESLLNALVKELEVEIPNTLIEFEVRSIVEKTARNFAQQGIDVKSIFTPELVESLMKSSRPEAEENLRKNLALQALAKQEKIEVENSAIEERFKEVSVELKNEKGFDPKKLKEILTDELMQEKLLKWLEENNTVNEINPKKENQAKEDNEKSTKGTAKSKKTTKSANK